MSTSSSPQEQLIQSGFELIVKAFDEQNLNTQKTIDELQEKINSLAQENQNMKEENQFLQNEIKQLRLINKKLQYSLESTRSKLDMIKLSILDDNPNANTNQNIFNNIFKKPSNNINNINNTHSEYYLNTVNTVSTDIKFDGDDEIISGNNGIGEDSDNDITFINKNTSKISKPRNNMSEMISNSKIKIDKNYLEHLKSHSKQNSNNFRDNSNNKVNNVNGLININNTSLTGVNSFLIKCKDNMSPQTLEKLLLLFNNHKSGLISSCDMISRVREILQTNTNLLVQFNKLLTIQK